MITKIPLKEALDEMKTGKFFSVVFTKRSTGEDRKLNGRRGVVKYLKGGEKPYNNEDYKLITVFDVQIKQYRSIPIDSIKLFNNKEILR